MKKVSTAVRQQGSNFSQPTGTIGLDLADRNSRYRVLDEAGQIHAVHSPFRGSMSVIEIYRQRHLP
ncbi:MAG TPA: hypothetical protein VFB28_10405 [Terriglobales bacterium]|nr:hypothetical protein [Terriglobales bacterium]